MDSGLKNKSAVVIAGSKGLGKAAALALAAEGCRIGICSRNPENLSSAEDEIKQTHGMGVYTECVDIAQQVQIENFISSCAENLNGIDILVTNSGGPPVKKFTQTTDAEWHEWYECTFMSVVRSIRFALPFMQKKHWGRIINITSIAVKAPVDNLVYSNALRSAVIGLSKTLSLEFGADGITVNNIAPGYHLTDGLERIITSKIKGGSSREEILQMWTGQIPVGRIGQPVDVGNAIVFLASESASFISGVTLQVDGGMYRGIM